MNQKRFLRQLYEVMGDETQKAFAARLGLSDATLSRLRSGQRQPGWRVIRALRREFPHLSLHDWGLEGPPLPRTRPGPERRATPPSLPG